MEASNSNSMLERYRRDREKLLQFILSSSNLIKEVRSTSGVVSPSSLNYDTISADYVISCISSGGVLDVAEATKSYYHESHYPVTIHSQSGDSYYVLSDPKQTGSPPRRGPPKVDNINKEFHRSAGQVKTYPDKNTVMKRNDNDLKHENGPIRPSKPLDFGEVPSLGLPPLKTGLSDDDLLESAYELLVASLVASGIDVVPDHVKKRERSSKLLSLKTRKEKTPRQPQSQERYNKLLDLIRVQLQISEAMDLCTRQRLVRCTSRNLYGQISIPEISLGLLSNTSRSSFPNEKSYIQWNNRQANMLEELISPTSNHAMGDIKLQIGRIRNAREWDMMSLSERADLLFSIKKAASKILPVAGQYNSGGESSYLVAGYHLNLRLYEKLLLALFDVLEEGQLIEEADEVMKLFELTWSTLGITQTIHVAMYCWVLFKQFVHTEEEMLIENAAHQVQNVLAALPCDKREAQYLNTLLCSCKIRGSMLQLSLLPAIFISISDFCDKPLQDYHIYFTQKSSKFKWTLTIAIAVVRVVPNQNGELMDSETFTKITSRRLKMFIEKSIQAAFARATDCLDLKSKSENGHPLAVLASMLRSIAEKELAIFCPVLHQWYPKAGMTSASLLHQLFEERLKPFLESVSSFSQDARSVLVGAHLVDHELSRLYSLSYGDKRSHLPLINNLDHYGIGEVSAPLILDWVIAQHDHILDWIGRAFDLEAWEPLSSQQKHAVSVVEVFRMIEENVHQLIGMDLPVNITHLQALLSIIIHSLDAYMNRLVDQLVERKHLYPSAPSLTRYEETIVPIVRKKVVESQVMDKGVRELLEQLTMSKLCVRLNTLQYIRNQITELEDALRKSWGLVKSTHKRRWFNETEENYAEAAERTMSANEESIDELFRTTFDAIRNTAFEAMSKIMDFVGAKAVFWDLRELFLFHLYRGSVEACRMEKVLPNIDGVLNQVCGLINDGLRDQVVLSIFRALLDGYVWVLLDGGPSRAFSDSDVLVMEDDLNILKDFLCG